MSTYLSLLDKHVKYEQALIGCIILDKDKAHYIFANMSKEYFLTERARITFNFLYQLWAKYGKVDNVIVLEKANAEDKAFVVACAETVPSLSSYKEYVKLIKQSFVKIKTLQACEMFLKTDGEDYEDFIAGINALDIEGEKQSVFTMQDLAKDFKIRKVDNKEKSEYIKAGIGLDKLVRLQKGEMVIVGARPSVGKTAYALQIALNMSNANKHVVFFSLETSADVLFERLIANQCSHDYEELLDNKIDFSDKRGQFELEHIQEHNITIVEAAGKTASWIESEALRLKADVVIVDYLTLIKSEGKTLYEKATQTSKDLHTMAQRRKLLTIVLAQLNRSGTGEPSMEHLRESGQIEQDADVIILLHCTDKWTEDEQTTSIVVKNKKGRCGKILLNFNKSIQQITAIETMRD